MTVNFETEHAITCIVKYNLRYYILYSETNMRSTYTLYCQLKVIVKYRNFHKQKSDKYKSNSIMDITKLKTSCER